MDSHRLVSLVRPRQAAQVATTRRTALGISLGGMVAGLSRMDAAAKKTRKKNKKKRCKIVAIDNPCDGQNWCLDRTQTCGPARVFGKCLVEATGGNICGELLFQANSCTECEPANCLNCRCVLAAGGGDRCNNGATGQDFVCVRPL